MVTEEEAEKLAIAACERYMTDCNLKNRDDAKLVAQKMLAVANDLFEMVHEGRAQVDTIN